MLSLPVVDGLVEGGPSPGADVGERAQSQRVWRGVSPSPGALWQGADWVMTIGGILLVILFWFGVNYVLAKKYDCMELTLLYLQCIALAMNFNTTWPSVIQIIKHYITIFNFEVLVPPITAVLARGAFPLRPMRA
jgi:hypothetical protein